MSGGTRMDKSNQFFAFLSRMKYIMRWSLMRNTNFENIQEHSHQVSIIAHALAVIKNVYFGGSVNADRVAVLALYHDSNAVSYTHLKVFPACCPLPVSHHPGYPN